MYSVILKNILDKLKVFLEKTYNAENYNALYPEYNGKKINEIFLKAEEVFLKIQGEWLKFKNKDITEKLLKDFCIEVSNIRGERFNREYPSLSTELPHPYERYRLQAFGEEILYQKQIQVIIRIPSDERFLIEDFDLEAKDFTYEQLKSLVKNKNNILISGGTGSGKTSLLNALLQEVDLKERIVTIEDSKELYVKNENKTELLISKQERGFTYEKALNIIMRSAPDRIFLGEIDTKNTLSFLRLANTGHSGMLSTIHANSAKEAIQAIISNALFSQNIAQNTLKGFIRSAIDYIIQIEAIREKIKGGGADDYIVKRKIKEIVDIKNEKSFYD